MQSRIPAGSPIGLRYADRLQQAAKYRTQAIESIGAGHSAALTALMGPMGQGPEWPAGAAWRAIRRDGRLLIFSDGLSDPWVERDQPETGLGLEVFIESPDPGLAGDAPLADAADTWLFPMVAEVSHLMAGRQRLREAPPDSGLSSLEFAIDLQAAGVGHWSIPRRASVLFTQRTSGKKQDEKCQA